MNKYELILFVWLNLLTIGVVFMIIEMLNRTNRLKGIVNDLFSYINTYLDPHLKIVRQLVLDEIVKRSDSEARKAHAESSHKDMGNNSIKTVTNEEEARTYPISQEENEVNE